VRPKGNNWRDCLAHLTRGGGARLARVIKVSLLNVGQPNLGVNSNLQQPFYQIMAYGPNIPSMGSGVPHRPVPDMFFPRTLALYTVGTVNDVGGGMTEGIWEQIARTLKEFGFTPRGCAKVYQKPYLKYFDTIPYPRGF
jgi:hypothetical protein